ncbi:MAG: hypothetical protein Q9168_000980 [Polycauliona sp. 1 TL-2023]
MVGFRTEYIAAGGNRHPAAADWDTVTGLLAYGSDINVALWRPLDAGHKGVSTLLYGHADTVNVVKFFYPGTDWPHLLLSGSADQTIRIWQADPSAHHLYTSVGILEDHTASINCLGVVPGRRVLASGAADATIKIWHLEYTKLQWNASLLQTIRTSPKFLPLTLCFAVTTTDDLLLAAAGTRGDIYLYGSKSSRDLIHQATLTGHEGWVRSLAIITETVEPNSDLLLASASQDKYIRVWRCRQSQGFDSEKDHELSGDVDFAGFLSNKTHSVQTRSRSYSLTFEALLLGHDDWVYTSVTDIAWARDGSYLLSIGADQTTRLHAKWTSDGADSWHEFARPQIHGYDLNCIDVIGELHFVSGADEKLLRVFDEPRSTAELLSRLCGVEGAFSGVLPGAANIPVLGLSNKALEPAAEIIPDPADQVFPDETLPSTGPEHMRIQKSRFPPMEDDLARHTLWPESEKLYGHGYEIASVAVSHNGLLIATACKASSLDHATIRLFETVEWRELKPPLVAHSLTVTSLRFSDDDCYLLSTGRDRQWSIFEKGQMDSRLFSLKTKCAKAHSRMILSSCWAPVEMGDMFVTGSRDKTYKIWNLQKTDGELVDTINAPGPVTAVDILRGLVQTMMVLAVGTETGEVSIHLLDKRTLKMNSSHRLKDP